MVYSEVDYINLLIKQEKFLEQIKALEGFRKQAKLVGAASNVQLKDGTSVFEQLRKHCAVCILVCLKINFQYNGQMYIAN